MKFFGYKILSSKVLTGGAIAALLLTGTPSQSALAATPTPLAGLQFLKKIAIPNWTTTGAKQASTDVWSFDPSTNTLYFADRVNKGVSAIDTTTNTYLGTLVVPTCDGTGSCPSGVLVAPDLHKLVVTDRNITSTALKSIFIYDLRMLSAAPVKLDIASGTNTDELDYDPLNHRAYVANTVAPYFVTVVDLLTNKIVDSIPLPSNPEQPRFNPIDGMIYQTIPDDAVNPGTNSAVLRIDPTKAGAAAIVTTLKLGPSCLTRGIDIDPLTNTALIGCAAPGAQVLLNLSGNMSVVTTFPGVTGTDTLYFNPNLRRWYTASSNNNAPSQSCPANAAGVTPVVGVFAAAGIRKAPAAIVGEECSGTNGHDIGVDPIRNQVYVGVRQAASDPNFSLALTNGTPGVLVWLDPSPLAQPEIIEETSARLAPSTIQNVDGRVLFADGHLIRAFLENLPAGNPLLNVTTTVGNEVIYCAKTGATASCDGILKGEALFGGNVLMSSGGAPLASGKIVKGNGGFGSDQRASQR